MKRETKPNEWSSLMISIDFLEKSETSDKLSFPSLFCCNFYELISPWIFPKALFDIIITMLRKSTAAIPIASFSACSCVMNLNQAVELNWIKDFASLKLLLLFEGNFLHRQIVVKLREPSRESFSTRCFLEEKFLLSLEFMSWICMKARTLAAPRISIPQNLAQVRSRERGNLPRTKSAFLQFALFTVESPAETFLFYRCDPNLWLAWFSP